MTRLLLLALLLLSLLLFTPSPALAQSSITIDPIPQQRVDLFDSNSNRTGYAIIDQKAGRVETFNQQSQRTGYGVINNGRIDFFDNRSNRVGSGKLSK